MLGRLVTLECQLVDLPADHQPPASISASRVQISPLKVPSHCEACQNGLDGRGNDLPVLATLHLKASAIHHDKTAVYL